MPETEVVKEKMLLTTKLDIEHAVEDILEHFRRPELFHITASIYAALTEQHHFINIPADL